MTRSRATRPPVARRWSGALLAGGALVLAACSPSELDLRQQSELSQIFERHSGRIAYMDVDGNIYTVDQRGSGQENVTADAVLPSDGQGLLRYYQFPVWAPSGERLAFVRIQGVDQQATSTAVITTDPDGTAATEAFTSGEALPNYLYWSPDSAHLTFVTNAGTGAAWSLQLVPEGGGEATVVDAGSPLYWCWTPDGQTVLIHAGGSGISSRSRIAFVNVFGYIYEEGLQLRPGPFRAPGCSPHGDRILVAAQSGGQSSLIMTSRSGDVLEAIGRSDNALTFSWSPDGQRVAYVGQEGPIGDLHVVDVASPDAEPLAITDQQLVMAFFWSPDSEKIAYFVQHTPPPDPENPDAEQPFQLTLLIHNLRKEETREVFSFRPAPHFMDVVLNFDQYSQSVRIWSPNSRHVLFSLLMPESNLPVIAAAKADSGLYPAGVVRGLVGFWSWQ